MIYSKRLGPVAIMWGRGPILSVVFRSGKGPALQMLPRPRIVR